MLDRTLLTMLGVALLGAVGTGVWMVAAPPPADPANAGYVHAHPHPVASRKAEPVRQKLHDLMHPPIPGMRLNG